MHLPHDTGPRLRAAHRAGTTQASALVLLGAVALTAAVAMAKLGVALEGAIAQRGADPADSLRGPAQPAGPTQPTWPAPAAQAATLTGIVQALEASDAALRASRPERMAAKYARMAEAPTLFYRGIVPLFLRDWLGGAAAHSDFGLEKLVLGPGDAHPGNFGLLRGADGLLRLEPNDFDTVGRYPYLWDLRRLAAGLEVTLRETGASDAARRALLRVALDGYLRGAGDAGAGALRTGREAPPSSALFGGKEVPNRYLRKGARSLARGAVGDQRLEKLAAPRRGVLKRLLADYAERRFPGSRSPALRDAAQLEGKGVSSLPVDRALALVDGLGGRRALLEVKEIIDRPSMFAFSANPSASATAALLSDRIARSFAHAASGADWHVLDAKDGAYLVRELADGQRSVKMENWRRASEAEAKTLAGALGVTLRQLHDREPAVAEHLDRIASDAPDDFVREQLFFARRYGKRVLDAYSEFRDAR